MGAAPSVKILGIAGSLRKASFNRAALRAAQRLVPQGATLEIAEIGDLPPYNQDLEADLPPAVAEFKLRIRRADAILFVTAEYNYSVPGVLKNAIDWGTQPHGDNAWDGKPAAIMGASNSIVGSARAQYHLRQVLVAVNVHALNRPEVLIGKAAEKFAQDGSLTDEPTAERIRQLLAALVQWTRVLQQGRADD